MSGCFGRGMRFGLGLACTLILGGAVCRAETPGREWSRFWGTWNAEGTAVCADTNGNVYVVGYNDLNLGATNAPAGAVRFYQVKAHGP